MPLVPSPLEAIGILPLVGKALKDFRARSEIQTLFRLVSRDVRQSDLLPFGTADAVVERLNGLLVQPEIAGALTTWLDTGESRVREPLKARLAQLLDFEEVGIQSEALADLVVRSIEAHLSMAKRSDREAIHLDGQVTRDLVRELKDQIAGESMMGSATALNVRAIQVARAVVELAPDQTDVVEKLVVEDPEGATALQEAVAAGGPARVAEVIDVGQPWLEQSSAAVWEAAGRLAESIGRLAQAQRAYERAAEHPAVRDRARQMVRASNAAAAQGDQGRATELLNAARNDDGGNPAVLLHDARDTDDPEKRLALLDKIVPADDDQAAGVEITRAEAAIAQGEFGSAREAIARARNLQRDGRAADELEAVTVLTEAQSGLPDDQEPAPESLLSAAQQFVRLSEDVRTQERWDAVGIFMGRAILSFALGGNSDEAARLLNEAIADERLHGHLAVRRLLASGALLLRRFDVVLTLTPESDDENDRLDRLAAHVMGGDAESSATAASQLQELMSAGGEGASRAAYLLLCASANNTAVEWDVEAERIIAAEQPWTVTMLRVFRLDAEGDLAGAEAHLLPHSDNPTALRYLVHLAGRREDHEKALRLSETLVQRTGAPSDQLLLAAALARTGQKDKAVDRLLALARDQHVGFDYRCMAYARAARLTQEAEDFIELESLAREWAGYDSSSDPRWMSILALTMRFRHAEALSTWRDFGEPDANIESRAQLLGEVFGFAAEPVDALQTLAALSDRYGRPEELEVGLILTSIRLEHAAPELPAELEARIRESFATFPERFPNSTRLRSISLDLENPVGSLIEAIGDQLEHRAEQTTRLAIGVRAGTTAVAMLASAAGRSTGETLFLLEALPISYPDDQFDRLDKADAVAAYDAGGAVWDANAIFVVASFGGELEKNIRGVLPASLVARVTQQDAAQDSATSNQGERGEIALVDGAVQVRAWSEFDREANHRRVTEMLRLATDLPAKSVADDDSGDELATITNGSAPIPIRSWAATLALARETGLAVFSDDRAVRKSAREIGVRAFGTTALLDVMADRNVIPSTTKDSVRRRLLSRGAWGMRHTVDELARIAREAGWQPSAGLRAPLGDTTAWFALRTEWLERVLGFLDVVSREAPREMDKWVHRAVDALTHDVGGNYQAHAVLFLLSALNPFGESPHMSDSGLRALISSLRRMRYFQIFRPPADLLVMAFAQLLQIPDDPRARAALFRRVSDRLSQEDQALLRERFVQ